MLAALDYLKGLKTPKGQPLVGDRMGAYGVELGAYAALKAAKQDTRVRVLVLDSVPGSPDELLHAAVKENTGVENPVIQFFARVATRVYFVGSYDNTTSCAIAASLPEPTCAPALGRGCRVSARFNRGARAVLSESR